MDCDRLWERSYRLSVNGSQIRALDLQWMILALCAHGAKHGPFPWPVLKWVTDIEALARSLPPEGWTDLVSRARELGCRRMLLLGMFLARDLLGAPAPLEIEEDLARDGGIGRLARPIQARILGHEARGFTLAEQLRFDLSIRERSRDRIAYSASRVLTPSQRDLSGPRESHPFLRTPRRLIRLVTRYVLNPVRGWTFLMGSRGPTKPSDG